MLLTLEKVIILKSVSLFSQVPEEYLVDLASSLRELQMRAGERILEKGDVGNSAFVIVEGEVSVDNGEQELAVLKEREVFGELEVLDPKTRAANVTARTDCYLFEIAAGPLYELIGEHEEVARAVIQVLCQRIRSAMSASSL